MLVFSSSESFNAVRLTGRKGNLSWRNDQFTDLLNEIRLQADVVVCRRWLRSRNRVFTDRKMLHKCLRVFPVGSNQSGRRRFFEQGEIVYGHLYW